MTRRRLFVTRDDRTLEVDVETVAPERFRVRLAGSAEAVEVTLLGRAGATSVTARGRVFSFFGAEELVAHPGRHELGVSSRPRARSNGDAGAKAGEKVVRAPMPGRVLKVLVNAGQAVSPGTALVVVEAMKMENELLAAHAGVVKSVRVTAGDPVERDAPLLELE